MKDKYDFSQAERGRFFRDRAVAARPVKRTRYAVMIARAGPNYSAYVPDLPGCVATGGTVEDVEREIRDAIRFHLDRLREDGLPLPEPTSLAEYIAS